jgi:hypothetical protein
MAEYVERAKMLMRELAKYVEAAKMPKSLQRMDSWLYNTPKELGRLNLRNRRDVAAVTLHALNQLTGLAKRKLPSPKEP